MSVDLSAQLPDGNFFPFWEDKTEYKNILFVDGNNSSASDSNPGSKEKPFKTINAAAKIAEPGTKVIIKGGEYRETVKPVRGGNDNTSMISYEASPGEKVVIKASVRVDNFIPSEGWRLDSNHTDTPPQEWAKLWEIDLDPEDFKGYNPFCTANIIHDRWFLVYSNADMVPYLNRRGMVFVDGKPLKQVSLYFLLGQETGTYWVESNGQKVHIRLPDDSDPKDHVIELSSREQCFAPDIPFLSYIHLKGLICAHAATGSPVPQRGSISACRGHHWIIEGCTIDWSNALGIDLGNECWHRQPIENQILGYHIIRGNTIRDAGVCGLAALGSKNVLVEDNLIDGTGWQRMELGWESGGLKFHGAQDGLFRRNIISNTIGCSAFWLDGHNCNCRVTGNVFIDNYKSRECVFMEANRDEENLIDNNIVWNVEGRFNPVLIKKESGSAPWYKEVQPSPMERDQSDIENGWGVYNLGTDYTRVSNNLIGKCFNAGFYSKTATFRLMRRGSTDRDNKFFNNIFYDCGEAAIKMPNPDNEAEGNAYVKMPKQGGYLRILAPPPNKCLDLPAWQKFYGFDLTGCVSDMIIEVDSKKMEMTIEVKQMLPAVKPDPKVKTDYFVQPVDLGSRVPGPFPSLKAGKNVFNIDPRRYGE
jgi:hypothetical protein